MTLMKFCLKVTACVFVFVGTVAQTALAQDLGVVVGFRNDQADSETAGTSITGKGGIQGGMVAKFELNGPLQIRTGAIYLERSYGVKTGTAAEELLKASYLEIPVGLLYKFSDYGGVFLGAAIGLNIAKQCPGGCSTSSLNMTPVPLQFGGSFKVAPQFGFEFYYETMTGKFATGVTNARAIAANLMITFD
jgi:hypothetical protein